MSNENKQNDEPRNVQGMTRAEFEHYLRVGFQHDNVRAHERGCGPADYKLTADQEREIAERVERNYPVKGTFACPICGKDKPHEHTGAEIAQHRINSIAPSLATDAEAALTRIESILASEIECSIFEEHVQPALRVAAKALTARSEKKA